MVRYREEGTNKARRTALTIDEAVEQNAELVYRIAEEEVN